MSITTSTPPVVIPPEVTAFAAEQGAAEYLPRFVDLVQKVYAGQPITVKIVDDPELCYNRTIIFRVLVPGWDDERYFQAQDRWYDGAVAICPSSTHRNLFGLSVWSGE